MLQYRQGCVLRSFKAGTNTIQQHTVCFVPARFYRGTDSKAPTVITGKFPSVSRQIRKGPDPTSASIPKKGSINSTLNSLCFLPRACAFQSPQKQCPRCSMKTSFTELLNLTLASACCFLFGILAAQTQTSHAQTSSMDS